MLKRWGSDTICALCVILTAFVASPLAAQGVQGNIVTGVEGGTDLHIGEDIAKLGRECGLRLNARESAGSVENMRAVRDRRLTQLGIVQSDVLEYYQTFQGDDPDLRRLVRGIRIAFPLYDEEVHVLTRKDIEGLDGLGGRRVAVGLPDSGTRLTANLILDLAQVEPAERVDLAPDAALDALIAGDIDAFFYVVGAPAALFQTERIDGGAFHLLPLGGAVLSAVYSAAEIAAGTYPFVREPVELLGVKAILVTFDYDPRENTYQQASCRLVADVSHLIVSHFDELEASGHPKWKSVNVTEIPPGWQVSACVLQGVDPDYSFTCRRPDGHEEREGPGGTDASAANALFLDRVCRRIGC